jgi:hypothetical protein
VGLGFEALVEVVEGRRGLARRRLAALLQAEPRIEDLVCRRVANGRALSLGPNLRRQRPQGRTHTHTRMHTRTSSLIEVRNVSRHAQQQCDASNDNSRRREDCAWVCSKHSGWVCAHSASTHLLDRPHRRLYRGGARLLRVLLVRHVPSRVLPKYVNADPLPPVPRRQHNAMQCE